MRIPRCWVRVLAEDDDFDSVKRAGLECCERVFGRWQYSRCCTLVLQKATEICELCRLECWPQGLSPRRLQLVPLMRCCSCRWNVSAARMETAKARRHCLERARDMPGE